MSLRKRRRIRSLSGHKKALEQLQKHGYKMELCQTCGINEERVDANSLLVMCSPCIQKQAAPPPAPKPPKSPEEKALKAARKLERAARRVAKEEGLVLAPKDLGFSHGWHRRKLFRTELTEKAEKTDLRYFSFGKEITQAKYEQLAQEVLARELAKVKPTAEWGRGWWFKKKFVAPDGSVWKKGKKVS